MANRQNLLLAFKGSLEFQIKLFIFLECESFALLLGMQHWIDDMIFGLNMVIPVSGGERVVVVGEGDGLVFIFEEDGFGVLGLEFICGGFEFGDEVFVDQDEVISEGADLLLSKDMVIVGEESGNELGEVECRVEEKMSGGKSQRTAQILLFVGLHRIGKMHKLDILFVLDVLGHRVIEIE